MQWYGAADPVFPGIILARPCSSFSFSASEFCAGDAMMQAALRQIPLFIASVAARFRSRPTNTLRSKLYLIRSTLNPVQPLRLNL